MNFIDPVLANRGCTDATLFCVQHFIASHTSTSTQTIGSNLFISATTVGIAHHLKPHTSFLCLSARSGVTGGNGIHFERNMLGLFDIFKVLLLLVNSMAILHEERFLKKGLFIKS